jgi:hypothetical protein
MKMKSHRLAESPIALALLKTSYHTGICCQAELGWLGLGHANDKKRDCAGDYFS